MSTITTTAVHCRRCRASFALPSLSDFECVRIAEVVRAGRHIEAFRLLHQPSTIEMRDAQGCWVAHNAHTWSLSALQRAVAEFGADRLPEVWFTQFRLVEIMCLWLNHALQR